jgi:hypothetical protein
MLYMYEKVKNVRMENVGLWCRRRMLSPHHAGFGNKKIEHVCWFLRGKVAFLFFAPRLVRQLRSLVVVCLLAFVIPFCWAQCKSKLLVGIFPDGRTVAVDIR